MDPSTGKFEKLYEGLSEQLLEDHKVALANHLNLEYPNLSQEGEKGGLVRANGEPVPRHWPVLRIGQKVVVEGITMNVAYINECTVVLEPSKLEMEKGDDR